ncbi:MAG: hypothetical protein EBS19_15445, partial [Spirochaetia bacterium]|nr:hypothetical protein [Spirochaetia bacterium]
DTDDTNFPNDKVPKGNKQSNSHKISPNKHKVSSKRIVASSEKDTKSLKTGSEKQNNLKLNNPFHKLMWDGDLPVPNILKVKYLILEESLKENSEHTKLMNRNYVPTAIIHLDKNLTEEVKDALTSFLQFCQAMLNIEEFPEIYIVSERMPGMTTGAYLPSRKVVLALAENRLMIDVFRTIAHELTHCKQHERGELDNLPERKGEDDMSDVNTPYENEAYMNSGNFSKAWARLYKKLSRDEIFSTSM